MSNKDKNTVFTPLNNEDLGSFSEEKIKQLMWLIKRAQANKRFFEKYRPEEIEKFRFMEDLYYSTDDFIDDNFKLNIQAGHDYSDITKTGGETFIFDIQPILKILTIRGYIESYVIRYPDNDRNYHRIVLNNIDFDKFDELFTTLSECLTRNITYDKPKKHLITKNDQGDFYFRNKKMLIKKDTLHCQILEVLVDSGSSTDVVTYEQIISFLKKQGQIDNNTPWRSRISNAIKDGLMKTKIEDKCLRDYLSDDKPLIKPISGIGLIFNNVDL